MKIKIKIKLKANEPLMTSEEEFAEEMDLV